MPYILSLARAVAGALVLALGVVSPLAAQAFRPIEAHAQTRQMQRSVNVLGYDAFWKPGGQARFQQKHFAIIKSGGFDTIRVNLHAFEHMDAEGKLEDQWLKKLDWVVSEGTKAGLTVILDEHDFQYCGDNPDPCRTKLLAFWRQVAPRYKAAPNTVVFEILNEPNKQLDARWNSLMAEALAIIRASNPTRNVIVGPASWNNIGWLDRLELPKTDRHLIVTVHYYLPMEFTHQGAPWNPATPQTGVTWGTEAELQRLSLDFDGVQTWAKANDRPILLGEFGAYDKGPLESRVRYTAAAARAAEARGWAWAYWQFDSDFIAYDIGKDQWFEPIRKALIP